MAIIINEESRTFNEFLLLPGLTKKKHIPANVSLKTPLVKYKKGQNSSMTLNIPFVSSIMQSISDDKLAIALAKEGGLSFIYHSQSIKNQAKMIKNVKKYVLDSAANKSTSNPLIDNQKKLLAGAGISTWDYEKRIPELVKAGADIFCIDSSDGYSEWQMETIKFAKEKYKGKIKIGAGNVVNKDGFYYLAENGADFIKVGVGPGSICITREQKGIGRGQASALIEINEVRQQYYKEKGVYIPLCSDGGISNDHHIMLALALGADFVMMGRYFARFDESPTNKVEIRNSLYKEYWAEGTNKACNWQRYNLGGEKKLMFEEGVYGYVPYAGKLSDNVHTTVSKIKSTMCNCGASSIKELQQNARIIRLSDVSIRENGVHDILTKENIKNSMMQ